MEFNLTFFILINTCYLMPDTIHQQIAQGAPCKYRKRQRHAKKKVTFLNHLRQNYVRKICIFQSLLAMIKFSLAFSGVCDGCVGAFELWAKLEKFVCLRVPTPSTWHSPASEQSSIRVKRTKINYIRF